jgi:predicted 3-demethylubiquinone-9 3-methyltransferase (glyoxalase superfamily)
MREAKTSTFLWFQDGLEDALNFYKSTFTDIDVKSEDRMDGRLFTADFSIHGYSFIGMNMATTGKNYFNDSISIMIQVDGQAEVDRIYDAIVKDGEEIACGWCRDKWGVVWQIVPFQLRDWVGHPDPEVQQYAWQALRGMKKIIIDQLHQ